MALALDASTPANVTGNPSTLTTASFTPPAGAVLFVIFQINSDSGSATNHITNITDNLGTPLTYTQQAKYGTDDSDDAITYLYTARVVTSAAMTVSCTQYSLIALSRYAQLRVCVVTGADVSTTTSMIGAKGGARGRTTNLTGAAAQYTSTVNNSWGWCTYADWGAQGVPTAGSGQTIDSSYHVAGQDSYAVIKQNSTTATAGTTVTMSTTAPTSSLQLAYIFFEMKPESGGATAAWLQRNYWWDNY